MVCCSGSLPWIGGFSWLLPYENLLFYIENKDIAVMGDFWVIYIEQTTDDLANDFAVT